MSKTIRIRKSSSIKLLKKIQIIDKEGKVKYDSGLGTAHSWTSEMIKQLVSLFSDRSITPTFNEIDGGTTVIATKTQWDNGNFYGVGRVDGDAGDDDEGIIVGYIDTDLWPESYEDRLLPGRISHGTGSGELEYAALQWDAAAVVGSNVDWVLYRDFTNSSGATVTVNEIGIYALVDYSGGGEYVCYARDVLPDEIDIPSGDILRVTYVYRTNPADGLVLQFLQVVSCIQTWRTESPTINNTDGNPDSITGTVNWEDSNYPCDVFGDETDINKGIVLGSDDTAVTNNDYDLGTPIEHGTGAGQLYYTGHKASELKEEEGGTPEVIQYSQWTFHRYFINMSGGSITVKEIGWKCQIDGGTYALLGRIVLDTPIVLPDSGKLAVALTLKAEP